MKLAIVTGILLAALTGVARADTVVENDSGVISVSSSSGDAHNHATFFQNNPDALKIGTQSKPVEPYWWELLIGGLFLAIGLFWLLALP